jgi:hypothetical protein
MPAFRGRKAVFVSLRSWQRSDLHSFSHRFVQIFSPKTVGRARNGPKGIRTLQHFCLNRFHHLLAAVLLITAVLLCYSNSLPCAWHMDDYANIVKNPNVHPDRLSLDQLKSALYGRDASRKRIERPLAFLTFALNYYYSGENVFGYHLVNLIIHLSASLFLYSLILSLFKLPALAASSRRNAFFLALFVSLFWATHPIQVTAVTYIVQRMASLSALFTIASMTLYVRGRMASSRAASAGFFVFSFISFLLALFSKENAVLIPFSLLLIEFCFITSSARPFLLRCCLSVLPALACLVLIGSYYFDLSSLATAGYANRPFTMWERVLTQPRVLFFYLQQLGYPRSGIFALFHDIPVSTGPFQPPTTILSILGLVAGSISAVAFHRRWPLLSFGFLFFVVNHSVESTILPLEIVFEHRNYLPSLGFFIAVGAVTLSLYRYRATPSSIRKLVLFTLVFLLFAQGHTTWLRNQDFRTAISLWEDNVKKYPRISRPRMNLGKAYLVNGLYLEGYEQLLKALSSRGAARRDQKWEVHYNLAILFHAFGNREMCLYHLHRAQALKRGDRTSIRNAIRRIKQGERKALPVG